MASGNRSVLILGSRLRQGSAGAGRRGSDGAQLTLFVEHLLIMALWPVYVQPVFRPLSFLAYRYFLLLAMVSHAYKVKPLRVLTG